MAATITDQLKRTMLKTIYDRTQNIGVLDGDSDRHDIAIGRSEDWPLESEPPIPFSGVDETLQFRSSIQSMKSLPDVSYVVPRFSWVAGSFYEAWDSQYNSNTEIKNSTTPSGAFAPNPYYVLTDDNNVYICVQQGRTSSGQPRTSLFKPIGIGEIPFSAGADGYIWKFLYNIGAAQARKFLTSSYMPVERIVDELAGGPPDNDLTVSRLQQRVIQASAVPGQIIGIAVDNGGEGFTASPTIIIQGVVRQGVEEITTEASAYANVLNGSITEVIMKPDAAQALYSMGIDYADASVSVSGTGTNARLRAILSTDSGMGGNPVLDLNSSALMFNAQLTGDEANDFQTTNDFRQIGIVLNPMRDSAQLPATAATLSAFKRLYVTQGNLNVENITGDQLITQGGSSAVIDYLDTSAGIMYVHQTRETGFEPFEESTIMTVSNSGGTCLPVTVIDQPVLRPSEVDRYSGEIIYIDNRIAVSRDDDQTEDIKVVIDL